MTLWPSLLPPVCDSLWFTADLPKNELEELAALEEELEQEKNQLKDQAPDLYGIDRPNPNEVNEDEQDYDETEDESYMGDAVSDADLDGQPTSPTW